jgi:signal transduction histidine kinase
MDRAGGIDKLAALLLENESRATEVARLLHDEVGPTLSGIGFHLQALGVPAEQLSPIQEYLDQAMEHVRTASGKLQSNVAGRSGLRLALELLVERTRGVIPASVTLRVSGTPRFPAPVAHAMYQVAELALQNACAHARATEIVVAMADQGIEVRDNGVGFDVPKTQAHPPGAGIVRMETYAGSANLHLRLASSVGKGTIVGIKTI